ncbi:MFS transporter [Streptococcus ovis]|uniref:MFS transporter n=1 Tax=Streptococcus ovis TaxID=82806 RepID=UPI000476D0F6|nr:MFS transporter [Streptococcus ovis]
MKKILNNRIYMTVLASDMLSNFGDIMYYLAMMNYILLLPDPKLALSLVSLSEMLPVLTGFVTGYLSDRTPDKIKTIKVTLIFRVLLYLLVGFIMSFTPALWIVVVVSIINVFSDMAGQYESGLYIPLSLRIISNEDRETSMAFRQTVSAMLNIFFQAASAVLVGWFTYTQLAVINAGTFLVSFLVMMGLTPSLKKLLRDHPVKIDENNKGGQEKKLVQGLGHSLKLALREMNRIPELKMSMVIVPVINGILAVLGTIGLLMMSTHKDFIIVNSATTIATLTISMTVGNILGSILTMNVLQKVDIFTLLRLACIGTSLIFLALYFRQPYWMMASLFATGITAGAVNPKFGALIYNRLPEETLATIDGGISTYFRLGVVFTQFFVSMMVLFLSATQIAFLFLIVSLFLILYNVKSIQQMA